MWELWKFIVWLFAILLRQPQWWWHVDRPRRPKPFEVEVVKMGFSLITYRVLLPPMVDRDVVKVQLSVEETLGESKTAADYIAGLDAEAIEFEVQQDAEVKLSLFYVDDAGNISPPRDLVFIATDKVPPRQPEIFTIEQVSERYVDDETPVDPAVVVTPPEEPHYSPGDGGVPG